MNTYRVVLGRFANTPFDVKIVRAKNCGEAEKKQSKLWVKETLTICMS